MRARRCSLHCHRGSSQSRRISLPFSQQSSPPLCPNQFNRSRSSCLRPLPQLRRQLRCSQHIRLLLSSHRNCQMQRSPLRFPKPRSGNCRLLQQHSPLHSLPTGKGKMLIRCSSSPAERASSSRRSIRSEDLSPTWNSSYRCAAAECTTGDSSSSRRSAPRRPRKFDDLTLRNRWPTTQHSKKASNLSRNWSSRGYSAQCCERTCRTALNPSQHMPRE